ncbi:DUF5020 family protein [Saccharicrinis sp. FJH62]|uniref:DUF5020 family protein n=1 Tax=Saccharicrinis sp. FJH62 TaxID=3344657 RepID=UPI0035D46041
MKNKLLLALMLVFASATFAQNVQLHYDFEREHFTSTVEMFKPDNWGNTFFFIDMDYNGPSSGVSLAYWEIARELKFWDAPISAHIEFDGGLISGVGSIGNAYLAGPSYSYNASDFSYGITLMALYKYIALTPTDKPHNFQLTAVWYWNMFNNKLTFSGFADFWKEDHTVSLDGFVEDFQSSSYIFLSEPQIWYNATKNFSVGSEIELSNDFGGIPGFKVRPTVACKWTF